METVSIHGILCTSHSVHVGALRLATRQGNLGCGACPVAAGAWVDRGAGFLLGMVSSRRTAPVLMRPRDLSQLVIIR